MKSKSKVLAVFISIITFGLGVLLTLAVLDPEVPSLVFSLTENIILFTSFFISFIAFIFSMITYFCIDSVNSITAMEGNVLENENYSIAYEEAVDQFENASNRVEFTKKLFSIVMPTKKSESCMNYADDLQKLIDYIIWFAYVDLKEPTVKQQCEAMIKIIDKEKSRYDKLSNGINYLLNENIKLIKYVFDYQKIKSEGISSQFSKLENIRGDMLKNPISRIIYFDYLGLDYRRKAADILKACGDDNSEFSAEHMTKIREHDYTEEQLKHFTCLIDRAEMCFEKAQEIAKDNVLWNGYISYNRLRVEVMKNLMGNDQSCEEVLKEIDRVIRIRENAEFMFKRNNSYLNTQFAKETERVQELKEYYKLCMNINDTN